MTRRQRGLLLMFVGAVMLVVLLPILVVRLQ